MYTNKEKMPSPQKENQEYAFIIVRVGITPPPNADTNPQWGNRSREISSGVVHILEQQQDILRFPLEVCSSIYKAQSDMVGA